MRWNQPLDEVLGSRAKMQILRCLANATEPLSGREIGRRVGLSHAGVLRALEGLSAEGLLTPDGRSGSTRYQLRLRSDLVRRHLLPMFRWERERIDRIVSLVLAKAPDALAIMLFGSTARGESGPRSDVDLLVVVPDDVDAGRVSDAVDWIGALDTVGLYVDGLVWNLKELRAAARNRLPLLSEILREGTLLYGTPLPELIASRSRRAAG